MVVHPPWLRRQMSVISALATSTMFVLIFTDATGAEWLVILTMCRSEAVSSERGPLDVL